MTSINLNPNIKNKGNFENNLTTLFHEMGHAIDDLASRTVYSKSSKYKFSGAMLEDFEDIVKSLKTGDGRITPRDIANLFSDDNSSGVQDILGSAKFIAKKFSVLGDYRYKWAHSDAYWKRSNAQFEAASELFAHISSAQVSKKEMAYIEKYFPKAKAEFDKIRGGR